MMLKLVCLLGGLLLLSGNSLKAEVLEVGNYVLLDRQTAHEIELQQMRERLDSNLQIFNLGRLTSRSEILAAGFSEEAYQQMKSQSVQARRELNQMAEYLEEFDQYKQLPIAASEGGGIILSSSSQGPVATQLFDDLNVDQITNIIAAKNNNKCCNDDDAVSSTCDAQNNSYCKLRRHAGCTLNADDCPDDDE